MGTWRCTIYIFTHDLIKRDYLSSRLLSVREIFLYFGTGYRKPGFFCSKFYWFCLLAGAGDKYLVEKPVSIKHFFSQDQNVPLILYLTSETL